MRSSLNFLQNLHTKELLMFFQLFDFLSKVPNPRATVPAEFRQKQHGVAFRIKKKTKFDGVFLRKCIIQKTFSSVSMHRLQAVIYCIYSVIKIPSRVTYEGVFSIFSIVFFRHFVCPKFNLLVAQYASLATSDSCDFVALFE